MIAAVNDTSAWSWPCQGPLPVPIAALAWHLFLGINAGELAAYSASKSAAWSLTNALRQELAAQKTQVLGLHMAYVDTDLTRGLDAPKSTPEDIVTRALDGLESGLDEVLADDLTGYVKQGLTAARPSYLPQIPA